MLQNTSLVQIHLFYPMLFLAFIVLIVTIGIVFRGKSADKKDTQIFVKSNDNAKDVTLNISNNMKDMHNDVVEHALPKEYENELHTLEVMVRELNDKVNYLYEEFLKLKNERK